MVVMEEANELALRLQSGKGPFPMFTSCCPAWVNLVEKKYPELIRHISSCKSPVAMMGALIKVFGDVSLVLKHIRHFSLKRFINGLRKSFILLLFPAQPKKMKQYVLLLVVALFATLIM